MGKTLKAPKRDGKQERAEIKAAFPDLSHLARGVLFWVYLHADPKTGKIGGYRNANFLRHPTMCLGLTRVEVLAALEEIQAADIISYVYVQPTSKHAGRITGQLLYSINDLFPSLGQ